MELAVAGIVIGLGYIFSNTKNKIEKFDVKLNYNTDIPNSGNNNGNTGWDKVIDDNAFIVDGKSQKDFENGGTKIKSFVHNNMVPFFGAKITQNTNIEATKNILNNFTGTSDTYRKKQEVGLFFKPEKNISNVYGHQNAKYSLNNRFKTSRFRNNETPMEQIRVGPGLNKGYTNTPSGGFHQGNKRDYILPKSVNELRTLNNPKVSYDGRIVSGMRINKRSMSSRLDKKLPDRYYENTPNRYFTTMGSVTGHAKYSQPMLKNTNRKTTILKNRISPASSVYGNKEIIHSKVKKSSKTQFKPDGIRNATLGNKWTIQKNKNSNIEHFNNNNNDNINDDYGRKTIKLNSNSRTDTCQKSVILNAKSLIDKEEVRNGQQPRFTRKENFIGNNRWSGNVEGPHNRQQYHEPNDKTRTTIKETTSINNYNGVLNPSNQLKTQYHQPGDKTRTTIKETTSINNYNGLINPSNQLKTQYHQPGDKTRTTIKETTSINNYNGVLNPSDQLKTQYHQPGDKTRTTIKETTSINNYNSNLNSQKPNKSTTYDPNDLAKTTTKETTIINNVVGNINTQTENTAYKHKHNNLVATTTHREMTSVNYTGNAEGVNGLTNGGYQVSNAKAKDTKRQFISDNEYTGGAGNAEGQKQMSYQDIYNATMKSLRNELEVLSSKRTPTKEGPKLNNQETNYTTVRTDSIASKRQLNPNKYNDNNIDNRLSKNMFDRKTLPNNQISDRMNTSILSPLKNNPYVKSLNSNVSMVSH